MGQIKKPGQKPEVITLKAVAQHIGLTPGTVSAVLNDSPSARSIPQETKNRIHAAAKELNYRPNFFARTLRNKRTYTIGVIAEEIGDSYSSPIISGIEQYLRKRDYFFLTVVHRHDPVLLTRYSQLLSERGVEGIITVDTTVQEAPALPTVAVAGHKKLKGVTNIVLDHVRAAVLALNHLKDLSHERIAFMKGNPVSSDAKDRWDAICQVAAEIGMKIDPELTVQIDTDDPTPMLGYPFTKQLLAREQAVYRAVCLQRHFCDRRDSSDSGTGTAGSPGYFGDGVRRYSGGRVSHSESDHGATAVEPHGRSGGAGPVGTN